MFAHLRSFLTAWTRRERFEDGLDDEVRFHLESHTEALIRSGVPKAEAARRARIHFGSIEGMKDDCRHARGLRLVDELARAAANLGLALRTLLKSPTVTGVAVVSLALGIGSNAAIFSLYSEILLRPLPVREPERLVNLEAPGPKPGTVTCGAAGGCDEVFSYPMFRDLEREQTVFTDLAAHRAMQVNAAFRSRSIHGTATLVSGSYFPTLGLAPAAGRLFGREIDEPLGGHPSVVLSHEFWQSDLGGSPDAIGSAMMVNGRSLTIIGVAPAGFRGTTLGPGPKIFVPLAMHGALSDGDVGFEDRRNYSTYLFGRLQPHLSIEQAAVGLAPLYRSILAEVEAPLQVDMGNQVLARFLAKPLLLRDGRRGQSRLDEGIDAPVLVLFAVTALVVLIACANIANLLLARSIARTSEMAVRLSLGARRRHLLAQLLTESWFLAALGGAAALVVAQWTLRFIGALLPPDVADMLRLELDPYAIPFTAVAALATGLLFGIVPALHGTRAELVSTLKDDAGQPAGGRSTSRFRNGLVVAQLAMALTLLVGAGLNIRSLHNMSSVDPGLRTDDVATFTLWPDPGYGDTRRQALHERLEAGLAAQPGVTGVAAATGLLFYGGTTTNVVVEGFETGPNPDGYVRFDAIAPGYFETLGIPLLAGRPFTDLDTQRTQKVAIVNEAFARRFNRERDVISSRLGYGDRNAGPDTEIVGLVPDTWSSSIYRPDPPMLYVPLRQHAASGGLSFYVRSSMPLDGLLRSIPPLVGGIDTNLPVTFLETLSQRHRDRNWQLRVGTILSTAFAVLATLLSAVGLYGVLAYTVAQRTREIGLRMALGADAWWLRAMVLGQIGRMTLLGAALGLAGAFVFGRVAQSLLYKIDGLPPAVVVAAVAGLMIVALAAGVGPAHRASRINPMIALRHR